MKIKIITSLIFLSLIAIAFADTKLKQQNISVYIDYKYGDMNYIKEQITNVNYVRYKNEADVFHNKIRGERNEFPRPIDHKPLHFHLIDKITGDNNHYQEKGKD